MSNQDTELRARLEAADLLEAHNAWRRGADREDRLQNVKALGEAIDTAVECLRATAPEVAQAGPVGHVQRMGSYRGIPALGCLLSTEAEKRLKIGDPLFAGPALRQKPAAPSDYQRMFSAAVASLAEISAALVIDGEEAETANGNELILERIGELLALEREAHAAAEDVLFHNGQTPAAPIPGMFRDEGDFVSVPRGLLGAACAAFDRPRQPESKVLAELRRYTVGDLSRAARQDDSKAPAADAQKPTEQKFIDLEGSLGWLG